jgi:hypothetical protein
VGDVFNWAHNQLFEEMKDNPDHLSSSLEKAINKVIAYAKLSGEKRMPFPTPDFHPVVKQIKNNWFFSKNTMDQLSDERAKNLESTIENYYEMLRFINPAKKRNIYDVINIKELTDLVDDATPSYQVYAATAKRKKDSEAILEGTEILLDNDSWWIGAIHNCGAAHFHAKCSGPERRLTLWCTAAPGVGCNFFKKYYRDDDPLIIFKDKRNQAGYQFSFSSDQFMDVSDKFVVNEKKTELIGLLASVENKIKPSYVYIHNAISGRWP